MNNPLVSIVTPSYNQGRFIEDAILSIKNQYYKYIEHIIVDGGSRDETLEVLKKYEGTYNMHWLSKVDGGMYDALNKGFALATGEIFAYLNCDDLYLPWTVSTAVQYIREQQLIFGDAINWDLTKKITTFIFTPPFDFGYYSTVADIVQPTVFFRRKVFEEVGCFNKGKYRLLGDCDYWLRCASAGFKPKKIFEILAIERNHAKTQRQSHLEQLKKEYIILHKKYANASKTQKVIYEILKRSYPRILICLYKIGLPSYWQRTRSSKLINLNWWRVIGEWLPINMRRSIGFRPFLDINRVFRFLNPINDG